MLGGILFAQKEIQRVIEAIKQMKEEIAKPAFEYVPKALDKNLVDSIEEKFSEEISQAYMVQNKQDRVQALNGIKENIVNEFISNEETTDILESDILLMGEV